MSVRSPASCGLARLPQNPEHFIRTSRQLRLRMSQDPPEYFRRPGGFLGFRIDVPPEMLAASTPAPGTFNKEATLGHFTLVHHQLRQVGAGPLSHESQNPKTACIIQVGIQASSREARTPAQAAMRWSLVPDAEP